MNLNDLKLLVDCAVADDKGTHIKFGFVDAARRLTRRGLIEKDPSYLGMLRITKAGNALVEKLLEAAK